MEASYTQGEVRAFTPDVEETRTVEFVISTSAKDRHGTRLNMNNWELSHYNRNPIVGYQHNLFGDMCNPPSPDDVLGVGRAWLEGGKLIGSVRFDPPEVNPLAEKIFRKILLGSLRATSVGFKPIKAPDGTYGRWGEGDEAERGANQTFYFHGQELLEFSIVNIPSNPEALARSFRDQTAHALAYISKVTGLRYSQIEALTVREILDVLSAKPQTSPPAQAVDAGRGMRDAVSAIRQQRVLQAIKAAKAINHH